MINLLPPEQKRQIRAGQSNFLLVRYCIASVLLAVLLFALAGGIYMIMNNSKKGAEAAIQQSTAKSSEYQEVQQEATEFSNNLATAKTILDKEVRYSQIAVRLAQALPSGVILSSIQLNSENFGQPMTLTASGKSYEDALRLKSALEQSPYFSNVYLGSVAQSSTEDTGYPVAITINVTISPEIAK
jgi:Tfp pilus assembly protein PilN